MKKLFLLSVPVIIFFISCMRQETTDTKKTNIDYFEPDKEYVHMVPDSLRTPEQQAVFNSLQKELPRVIGENVVVEDGHLVLKMTKEEFKETGLPVQYYDLILKDLENNNNFIDTTELEQSIEELWEKSMYGKYRKEE